MGGSLSASSCGARLRLLLCAWVELFASGAARRAFAFRFADFLLAGRLSVSTTALRVTRCETVRCRSGCPAARAGSVIIPSAENTTARRHTAARRLRSPSTRDCIVIAVSTVKVAAKPPEHLQAYPQAYLATSSEPGSSPNRKLSVINYVHLSNEVFECLHVRSA